MKQAILYIVLGILVVIGGLLYNDHRLIPEFLYYVFGGVSIAFGIYKLFTSETDQQNDLL